MTSLPWGLWKRQIAAIVRLEWKKNFFSRRALWLYLMALAPVLLTAAHSLVALNRGRWSHSLGDDSIIYAGIFHIAYLRMAIFLGCVVIFAHLFRGEILEKTLHYHFLAPLRREVLVAGKFLAALMAAMFFFAGSAGLAFLFTHMHFGAAFQEFLFLGPGLAHLGWYVLVAALACLGYGSVFLIVGMLLRNPMIPAALVMVWEAINPFLPPLLKKVSIIFYLKSLCPVDVPQQGPLVFLAVNAEPTPAWLAIPGLLLVAAATLWLASLRARRLEITYSE